MTTNTTTASQPNAAPSEFMPPLPETHYNGCGDGSEPLYTPLMVWAYAREYAKANFAAPALPEPAAAQEPSWTVQFYETEAENIELWLAQVLEEAEFDKNELVTVNRAKLRTIAENVLTFAKAALAPQPLAEVSAAQAVPIAYAIYGINGSGKHYLHDVKKLHDDWKIDDGGLGGYWSGNEPLTSPAAQAVPEGFALVPIFPTDAMVLAPGALRTDGKVAQIHRDIWARMIAAARSRSQPTPPGRRDGCQ